MIRVDGEHKHGPFSLRVSGFNALADRLDRVLGKVTEELLVAIGSEVEAILDLSATLVPVKTGYLRDSRYWSIGLDGKSKIKASLGYAADYAFYVHELPYHHEHGQWKFLSTAIAQRRAGMISRVEDAVWKAVT